MREVNIPIDDEIIRDLEVGEPVALTGVVLTGRDAVHKWMIDTFIRQTREPQGDDQAVYAAIKPLLDGGVIYHCGPVVCTGFDQKRGPLIFYPLSPDQSSTCPIRLRVCPGLPPQAQ